MASYTTPVLSGSVPNPVTQPLQGVLDWTQSTGGSDPAISLFVEMNTASQFTDTSSYANTVTNVGPATISALEAPSFEATSGKFNGTSQYLTVPNPSLGPLDLSTTDFTIEFWIWPITPQPNLNGEGVVFAVSDTSKINCFWNVGARNFVPAFFTGGGQNSTVGSVPASTWTAVAFVVRATTVQTYINGVLDNTATGMIRGSITPGTFDICNWTGAGGFEFGGYISNFRIATSALYNANYTPTGPLNSGGGGIPATGYDIYRDGASIAQVGQVLTYTDSVPAFGTYDYEVAAYVGGMDVSDLSNDVPLTYAQAVAGFPNCIFDEAIFGAYFGGQLNLVEFTYMPGRTPFEEGATNLIINRYKQEPTDARQRGVDFTQFVVPGELLQTVAVVGINAQGVPQSQTNPLVTPLVVTNVVIDPVTQLKFGYTVSGGQDGIEYTVQFATTTNIQSETLEEIFSINFLVEDMFP